MDSMNKISETNFDKFEIVKRIERMITQELVVCYTDSMLGSVLDFPTKTIEEIIQIKFSNWNLSGMFDSVSDMRNYYGISSSKIAEDKPNDTTILWYLQYVANCVQRVEDVCAESWNILGYKIKFHDKSYPSGIFSKIDSLLEHLNAKRIFDEESREIAVVRKDELSETVLAESPDILKLVNQYKALGTAGDLVRKRQILYSLYRDGYENELKQFQQDPPYFSKTFLSDLGLLIGRVARHHEEVMGNEQVTEKLLAMSDAEKERYYDLTLDYFLAFRAMLPCLQVKPCVDSLKS